MYISTKARKCIIKAGSFDNYLLNTKPKMIDSRFGLYLRELVIKKQKDPSFTVPYVPGQATMPKTKTKRSWEYRHIPAIYMPMHVKLMDHSAYYVKTPQEMSRHEILELEHELKMMDEPESDVKEEQDYETKEDGTLVNISPEWKEF